MMPHTKPKLISDQNDVVSALSSLSMPSLTPRQQLPMTKSFELRRNGSQLMRHKTPAETISETKRMLSNGMYAIVIETLKSKRALCFRNGNHCSGDTKKIEKKKTINIIKSDLK